MTGAKIRTLFVVLALLTLVQAVDAEGVKLDGSAYGGLKARMIGPAIMSGRITAVDAVNRDTRILYVGTASGGVWKSVNGGVTFKQVVKDLPMAVGALTIDQNNPQTIWVGSGECNVRNSVSIGTGLYRSSDGGKTWKRVGFKDSERISRVIVHPKDSKTVFVAVMGHLWNANEERGLYKTTDGGKTWKRLLYVDADTGCADLEMDPTEPDILYASMWEYRRKPYTFNSGGKGSGLYKSADGGKTWHELRKGLPKGKLGRIAVAIAPSRPGTVYAMVEAEKTALYRSHEMGENWEKVNDTIAVTMRPFYFSNLVVDPEDHRRLYAAGLFLSVSENGGESFNFGFSGTMHSDIHALWVDPNNPDHVLVGTDGGLYFSNNKGQNFDQAASLPVSQFYHVYYDMQTPYNVYGGLQDNGSWWGPSRTYGYFGIQNKDWNNVGYGDGFAVYPHPVKQHFVYWIWQGGRLVRSNLKTHEAKDIQPLPTKKGEPEYRYNWNAGLALSPSNPDALYVGAQFLFKSTDMGDTWKKISPDLTTNDPRKQQQYKSGGLTIDNTTAENHCSIFTIAESPLDPNVIWVGTDDGNVQVTRDGGKSWTNVVKNLPGLPAATWCSSVEAGHFDAGTAYATFDGHRHGDMKPYVYKTGDFGQTWTALATDDIMGYCHIVREDLKNENLIFLGTEFGLFVSLDGGAQWAHLKRALPQVSVRDMVIHPREHDLIIATHGLGIQIIDDITPLRSLTDEVLNMNAAILPSRPAVQEIPSLNQEFPAESEFSGENPPGGAFITYYLKKRHIFGPLKLEVLDHDGKVIQSLPTSKQRGLNRLSWGMRHKPPKAAGAPGLAMFVTTGPMVEEGTYTVRLTRGKKVYKGTIELVPDKISGHSKEDRTLRHKIVMELYHMQEELGYVADTVSGISKQIDKRLETSKSKGVKNKLKAFQKRLDTFHKSIVQHSGIMAEEKLRGKVMALYSSVIQYGGRPTEVQRHYLTVLDGQIKEAAGTFDRLIKKELPAVNSMLKGRGEKTLTYLTREEYVKKD